MKRKNVVWTLVGGVLVSCVVGLGIKEGVDWYGEREDWSGEMVVSEGQWLRLSKGLELRVSERGSELGGGEVRVEVKNVDPGGREISLAGLEVVGARCGGEVDCSGFGAIKGGESVEREVLVGESRGEVAVIRYRVGVGERVVHVV